MKLDLITNKAKLQEGINPNDEFYTPKYAIYPLLRYIDSSTTVWCPFDTEQSNFVKLLKNKGCNVVCSHIEKGEDFFNHLPKINIDYVISNPPYSLKAEVFERLFDLKIPFAMLVGVVGLFESKRRFEMFRDNNFEIMYFDKRVSYFKSYDDQKPSLNPPFSSVYICSSVLPDRIIFETLHKNNFDKDPLF